MVTLEQIKTLLNGVVQKIPKLVNPDWNEKNPDKPAYIKNKPDFKSWKEDLRYTLPAEVAGIYCIDLAEYVTSYGNPNKQFSLEIGTTFNEKLYDDILKVWETGTFPIFKGNANINGAHNELYGYMRSIGILLQVDDCFSHVGNGEGQYIPSPLNGIYVMLGNYRLHIRFDFSYEGDNYKQYYVGVIDRLEPVLLPTNVDADNNSVLFSGERDATWGKLSASDVGAIPAPASGCEVGQVVMVSAVDANGKPTVWEAVDMPGAISKKESKLIKRIELTEDSDPSTIKFDVPLESFAVYMESPVVEVTASWLISTGKASGQVSFHQTTVTRTNMIGKCALFARNESGVPVVYCADGKGSLTDGTFGGQAYTFGNFDGGLPFTYFSVNAQGDALMPAGSVIEIYGIEA